MIARMIALPEHATVVVQRDDPQIGDEQRGRLPARGRPGPERG